MIVIIYFMVSLPTKKIYSFATSILTLLPQADEGYLGRYFSRAKFKKCAKSVLNFLYRHVYGKA
jgi:hypothetical protein